MASTSHGTWAVIISLALHLAAMGLWKPDRPSTENLHMAGAIQCLSIVKQKKINPQALSKPKAKAPRRISRRRRLKKKAVVTKPSDIKQAVIETDDPANTPETLTNEKQAHGAIPIPAVIPKKRAPNHAETTRRYTNQIRKKIEESKIYPNRARRQYMEGAIRVRFTLSPQGGVKDIAIIRGSRFAALNIAAKRAILDAAPFPPLPDHMAKAPISMEVTICFELT